MRKVPGSIGANDVVWPPTASAGARDRPPAWASRVLPAGTLSVWSCGTVPAKIGGRPV